MLENYSARRGVNIPVISFVTRKLISGNKDAFVKQIAKELDVKIITKASQGHYVTVKGQEEKRVAAAVELITQLDQKAKIIADAQVLKTTGEVTQTAFDMVAAHLAPLLETAKRNLPALSIPDFFLEAEVPPEQRNYLGKAQEPASPKKAKHKAPEPEAETAEETDDNEWKPKPRALTIKFNEESFKPRNLSQAITYMASKDPANSYVFGAGPFGGGKTFTPMRAAFEMYNERRIDEILFIRPSASTGKDPGAMPGDARKKMDPYIKGGIASNVEKMIKTKLTELEQKKVVRAFTPDFERGETYDHAFILVDEPQNLTLQQAELLIGRLGEGSIMVFAGDIGGNQNDMKKGEFPGLAHLIATQGSGAETDPVLREATAFIEFKHEDSAARNKILPHVSKALNEPPAEYAALMAKIRETRTDSEIAKAIDLGREFAVSVLKKASQHTLERYGKDIRANFPAIYEQYRSELPPQKPSLKVA